MEYYYMSEEYIKGSAGEFRQGGYTEFKSGYIIIIYFLIKSLRINCHVSLKLKVKIDLFLKINSLLTFSH